MSRKRIKRKGPKPQRREVKLDQLHAALDRVKAAVDPSDYEILESAVDTLAFLTQELEAKGTTLARLRRLLFGPHSEKTKDVLGRDGDPSSGEAAAHGSEGQEGEAGANSGKKKRKGHGRIRAADYPGANTVEIQHPSLKHGDRCPECGKGNVYRQPDPRVLVRIVAMAPMTGTVYECERLRCGACGKVFTAPAPEGIGDAKYDDSVAAMVGLLKYGTGLPFNRIERLQRGLGIPLPAGTQWEIIKPAAARLVLVLEELIRQAAQGEVLHNDDTPMRILALFGGKPPHIEDGVTDPDRTGVQTTGIVAKVADHRIALFFTGRRHAGENLAAVLERRAAELPPPIQMCDAIAANTAGDFETIVAHCLAHGRRQFVDLVNNFPTECEHVLDTLRKVYKNDATTRELDLSDDERLRFHQQHSASLMADLKTWMRAQLDDKHVEPNSSLGDAFDYMIDHWKPLTLFLRQPGAPLDNNIAERSLKKAILHRKNSYFYKTLNGAHVGDLFMSLIHTAELCGANPFDYLVSLLTHEDGVAADPAAWMPWNYQEALGRPPDPLR